MDGQSNFQSQTPYVAERIHAAAIYCSDGRFGEQFDDFLHNGLSLPRYDRLAVPGGPACMAGHTEAYLEQQGVVSELKFLVDAHELERVVLIQHHGCAFYTHRLGLPEDLLQAQQRVDLYKAASFIRQVVKVPHIDTYFAHRTDSQHIQFEHVPLDLS